MCTDDVEDVCVAVLLGSDAALNNLEPLDHAIELQGQSLDMTCKTHDDAWRHGYQVQAIDGMSQADDEEVAIRHPCTVAMFNSLVLHDGGTGFTSEQDMQMRVQDPNVCNAAVINPPVIVSKHVPADLPWPERTRVRRNAMDVEKVTRKCLRPPQILMHTPSSVRVCSDLASRNGKSGHPIAIRRCHYRRCPKAASRNKAVERAHSAGSGCMIVSGVSSSHNRKIEPHVVHAL